MSWAPLLIAAVVGAGVLLAGLRTLARACVEHTIAGLLVLWTAALVSAAAVLEAFAWWLR